MKTYSVIGTEPIKPLDPKNYQGSDWGLIILTMIIAPLTLAAFQELFRIIQGRTKQKEKLEDSERQNVEKIVEKSLANKDALFIAFQDQNKQLLNEVITARDEDIKNLQATMSTTVQVVATIAENLKAYAEVAVKRSDETRLILEEIRKSSSHTILQSINSHIKINHQSLKNQDEIITLLKSIQKRLDKLNVPSSVDVDD